MASYQAPGTPTETLVQYLERKVIFFGEQLAVVRQQVLQEQQHRLRLQTELSHLRKHVQPQMQLALEHQHLQQQHQQLQRLLVSQASGQHQQLQQQRQLHQQQQQQLQQELDATKADAAAARVDVATERRDRRLAEFRLDAAQRVMRATRAAANWTRVLEELDNFEHSSPHGCHRSRSRPRR
jgi:hypothetical protein